MRKIFYPWWAWIGVLVVSFTVLMARGLDFSSGFSTIVTVLALIGLPLSIAVIVAHFVSSARSRTDRAD